MATIDELRHKIEELRHEELVLEAMRDFAEVEAEHQAYFRIGYDAGFDDGKLGKEYRREFPALAEKEA